MHTGKSMIGAQFNQRTGISVISTDHIVTMVSRGLPRIGVAYKSGSWKDTRRRVLRSAPFIDALVEASVEMATPMLIEGELDRRLVLDLKQRYGDRVQA